MLSGFIVDLKYSTEITTKFKKHEKNMFITVRDHILIAPVW